MWIYNGKQVKDIKDFPENTYGFIYEVTHLPTGKKYLGKKVLYFERNIKLGKRELQELKKERSQKGLKGRPPKKKKVIKESDWKKYYGSQKEIRELVKKETLENFSREILDIAENKKYLTYLETKLLFTREVLEKEEYLNDNIAGKFFRKDIS